MLRMTSIASRARPATEAVAQVRQPVGPQVRAAQVDAGGIARNPQMQGQRPLSPHINVSGARLFQSGPQPGSDPVQERVAFIAQIAAAPSNDRAGAVAYQLADVATDPDLTAAQKRQIIRDVMLLMAGNPPVSARGVQALSAEGREALVQGFEGVGSAWSGSETPEARDAMRDILGTLVNSRQLTVDTVQHLFDPAANRSAEGARSLLTGITDGAFLNRLAERLETRARPLIQGSYAEVVQASRLLLSAADIALMARANGAAASIEPIAGSIARLTSTDVSVPQGQLSPIQLMLIGDGTQRQVSGREGLTVLTRLLDAVPPASHGEPTDRIFAALVRDGAAINFPTNGNTAARSDGLERLARYLDQNLERILMRDWEFSGTENPRVMPYRGLTIDALVNVVLNPALPDNRGIADRMVTLVGTLTDRVADAALPLPDRQRAAEQLGVLVGSLRSAAALYVNNERAVAASRAQGIAFLEDVLFRTAIRAGGMASAYHPGSEQLNRTFFGFISGSLTRQAVEHARGHVQESIGLLLQTLDQVPVWFSNRLGDDPNRLISHYNFVLGSRDQLPPWQMR